MGKTNRNSSTLVQRKISGGHTGAVVEQYASTEMKAISKVNVWMDRIENGLKLTHLN